MTKPKKFKRQMYDRVRELPVQAKRKRKPWCVTALSNQRAFYKELRALGASEKVIAFLKLARLDGRLRIP